MPHRDIVLNGLSETLDALRISNEKLFGNLRDHRWFFRGHSSIDWQLKPAVWRDDFLETVRKNNPIFLHVGDMAFRSQQPVLSIDKIANDEERNRLRQATVRLFVELHHVYNFYTIANDVALAPNPLLYDMDGAWEDPRLFLTKPYPQHLALPQHHGIPTRLLDWTRDALTALTFALGDDPDAGDVAVWCLNVSSIKSTQSDVSYEPVDNAIAIYEGDNTTNKYLHAQRGAFTYAPLGEKHYVKAGHYPNVSDYANEKDLIKLTIRLTPDEKLYAAEILMRERRTRAHFMPDLSNCAEYAKQIFKLNTNFR